MTWTDLGTTAHRPTMTTTGLLQRSAAVCTAGAAIIHFSVAGQHFTQWWVFGLFFLVLAVAQTSWALLCWQPVGSALLISGALINLAVVGLWLVTRISGLPFGPEPGVAEAFGVADGVCAGLQLLSAVLAVLVVIRARRGVTATRIGRHSGAVLTAVVAALVLVASGTAIAAPTEHDEHGTTSAGTEMTAHDHGNGDRKAMPQLPDVSKATAAQTAAAADLLQKTTSATAKYRDVAVAGKAGFDIDAAIAKRAAKIAKRQGAAVKPAGKRIPALHVPNQANRQDGKLVDPAAPETLIYNRDAAGTLRLIGVMFTAEKTQPPTSYQPYLRWHFHSSCVAKGKVAEPEGTTCPSGSKLKESGYMTHVWFVLPDQLPYAFAMSPPRPQLAAYQTTVN